MRTFTQQNLNTFIKDHIEMLEGFYDNAVKLNSETLKERYLNQALSYQSMAVVFGDNEIYEQVDKVIKKMLKTQEGK